jgi:beta-lactamase superfamily II metal-dependent hydrolase
MLKRWLAVIILLLLLPWAGLAAEPVVFHGPSPGQAPYSPAQQVDISPPLGDNLLQVDFINITIGDCILLRCGGQTMLIDGGTSNRFDIVLNFLCAHDIQHLDYLLNTHAHDDHIEVQHRLVQSRFSIGEFLSLHAPDDQDPAIQKIRLMLAGRGIPYRQVFPGDEMQLGDAQLYFLGDDITQHASLNSRSLMTRVHFGDRSILLTADVTGKSQSVIADAFPGLLNVDIMQIPHHGYNLFHKNRLLNDASPEMVVITNRRRTVQRIEAVLQRRRMPRYYLPNGHIRLQTDGQIWHAWQQAD